ncbi:MAG: membrane integrity-associated transporter subunit PqiC [Proteobacteria bacterium]|nr:membrane integrity-associated transporter subunit PqiC [Pseudomonadota bacterium]
MRWLVCFFSILLLAGCQVLPAQKPARKNYDLGLMPILNQGSFTGTGLSAVDVSEIKAPGWLQTTDMYYRLSYADAARIRWYALSRWIRPPAQLLGPVVQKAFARHALLVTNGQAQQVRWKLSLRLNDFEQVFVSPGQSYARVVLTASLVQLPYRHFYAQRQFSIEVPAKRNTAQGGVAAFSDACVHLSAELAGWVMQHIQEAPSIPPGKTNSVTSLGAK